MRFCGQDGSMITDEMLERMAEPWDMGELPGMGGAVTRGRPRLGDEPSVVLSFKVPQSSAERITKAAQSCGESRSMFLRTAACAAADRVLAEM